MDENIQHISAHEFREGLAKYRTMVFAVVGYAILIALLMVGSMYFSNEIRKFSDKRAVADTYSLARNSLVLDLQKLQLLTVTNQVTPEKTQPLVEHIKKMNGLLQGAVDAFQKGTTTTTFAGRTITVEALHLGDNPERVRKIAEMWAPLKKDVDAYVKAAGTPEASTMLEPLLRRAEGQFADVTKLSNDLVVDFAIREDKNASLLTIAEGALAALSLLFVVVFVYYFIRRMVIDDHEIAAAHKETDEIMNTVNAGLFLLDKDLTIGSQYSKELENLLGQTNFSGKNLLDVLANMVSENDLNTANGFIGLLYNPRTKERLISSLNPLTRIPMTLPGRNSSRYLDFKFNRVYENDEIKRVLVSVTDVTDAVLLEQKAEQEREQNDTQLEMLGSMLQADSQLVQDFVTAAKRHTQSINNTLKSPGERSEELRAKAQSIYREVHSLKGEASTLKLHGFTVLAENVENELNKLNNVPHLSGENFLGLAVYLEELIKLTNMIDDLMDRLTRGAGTGVASGSADAQRSSTIGGYEKFVQDLAGRHNKLVGFSYTGLEKTDNNGVNSIVHEVAVQLLRNAVVHGIETPDERKALNKLPTGHVHMSLQDADGQYILSLEDDGKGIDYNAIRSKAVRLGMYTEEEAAKLTNKDLLMLIFSSGFSTLDKSNEDAGRGVGLDIIKDRIVGLKGKINVFSQSGHYTRFVFNIPKNS